MISQQDSARIDQGLTVVRVVWFAMLSSIGIYVYMSFALPVDNIDFNLSQELVGTLTLVAYALSPVLFLAARSVKKYTLSRAKVPSNMRPGPDGSTLHPAVAVYANATTFSLAIVELPAIAGLVLFFVGRNQQACLVLCGIAAAMMLYFLPRREEIEELALRMQRDAKLTA